MAITLTAGKIFANGVEYSASDVNTAFSGATVSLAAVVQAYVVSMSSGDVFDITNSGTGDSIEINSSSTGVCLDINKTGTGVGVCIDVANDGTAGCMILEQAGVLAAASYGVYLHSNAVQVNAGYLLYVYQENASSTSVMSVFTNAGTGHGVQVEQGGVSASSNYGLYIHSNSVQANSELVFIKQEHASSAGGGLSVFNAGTGNGLTLDQNGDGRALVIDTASTTIAPIRITSLASNPTGAHIVGDIAVVAGKLVICTVAGTPGTWTVVGDQAA